MEVLKIQSFRLLIKAAITLNLLVLINTYGMAQLELKPTVGINASRFNTDPKDSLDQISGRIGWQFGGTLLYGKKWYIESGFFMLRQGHELQTVDQNSQVVFFSNDIRSIYLPFMIGYHVAGNEEGLFGLRLFTGASIQAVTHIDSKVPDISMEDFRSPIWGISAGLGINFWLVFIDVSYQWDLTNTYANKPEDTKNQILRVNLGARINF